MKIENKLKLTRFLCVSAVFMIEWITIAIMMNIPVKVELKIIP